MSPVILAVVQAAFWNSDTGSPYRVIGAMGILPAATYAFGGLALSPRRLKTGSGANVIWPVSFGVVAGTLGIASAQGTLGLVVATSLRIPILKHKFHFFA